ncbi:enoyl-CoA hydratase-related protein [Paractinoplanes ferrugineus]|uniref:enoyl-CoA hydratase n=1 Tax=Paractinoplanes ferrugineus TaxID=113564 RepID=A0A919J2U6_9ACTN|nr:enoyl-CoA hydratase-related protein [Actinoplanes ferrugineus]GIE13766.1 3-hydroxybutyryl-CoA dehydratase [Actinoplanes ferrugineus]
MLDVTVADGVGTVVINRPPANAVNPELIEEFLTVLPDLAADAAVRCVVITGTGRFFVAGADIAVMRDLSMPNHIRMRRWIEVQRALELAPKPVIAAINGHALGGGAELSLACDLRIAAASASVGFPEMSLGLFPGAGGSQRLPRLLGAHRAKLLMIEGRRLGAAEALEIGLVDEVVPDADFAAAVADRAARWARLPTATVGLLKRSIVEGAPLGIDEAMRVEWAAVQRVLATEDAAEGLQSFLDKRPPTFTGR